MTGIFNFALSEVQSGSVSRSQRRYYGNYAGFLFDRSRLRSFAPGKANEVFYVPFERSTRELATAYEPSSALSETTYAHSFNRDKKKVCR